MAKKKFDTNQLDPEFPKKVVEMQEAETMSRFSAETQSFPNSVMTDEQTRKFEAAQYETAYQVPNYQPPAVYHTSNLVEKNEPVNRKIDKLGLPENILLALPYLPWGIGLIAGLVELLIVPKTEPKTRFHAAQGLALNIGILLITTILGVIDRFSDWASIGNFIFVITMTILSIIWAIKAYQGKPIHIESVDDLTNWLEEKVKIG